MCDSDSVAYNRRMRDNAKVPAKREKGAEEDFRPRPQGSWGDDGSWVPGGIPPERDCL